MNGVSERLYNRGALNGYVSLLALLKRKTIKISRFSRYFLISADRKLIKLVKLVFSAKTEKCFRFGDFDAFLIGKAISYMPLQFIIRIWMKVVRKQCILKWTGEKKHFLKY